MTTQLGEKIHKLRKEKRYTLERLAEISKLSKSYIWELENRDSPRPSAEKLAALASALDVNINFFIDDNVVDPQEDHIDQAFFRGYQELDGPDKERLRKILETFRSR